MLPYFKGQDSYVLQAPHHGYWNLLPRVFSVFNMAAARLLPNCRQIENREDLGTRLSKAQAEQKMASQQLT